MLGAWFTVLSPLAYIEPDDEVAGLGRPDADVPAGLPLLAVPAHAHPRLSLGLTRP